jgi:hypothetical protein
MRLRILGSQGRGRATVAIPASVMKAKKGLHFGRKPSRIVRQAKI